MGPCRGTGWPSFGLHDSGSGHWPVYPVGRAAAYVGRRLAPQPRVVADDPAGGPARVAASEMQPLGGEVNRGKERGNSTLEQVLNFPFPSSRPQVTPPRQGKPTVGRSPLRPIKGLKKGR